MPSRPSRPLRSAVQRTAVCALAVAVAAPFLVTTTAASATPSQAVTGRMDISSTSSWYTSGQFVLHNPTSGARDWTLRFRVPTGTFQNHSSWNTTTSVDGDVVTVTPTERLGAGASQWLSFGVSGDGSADLVPEACDLDGVAVDGCTTDAEQPEDTTAPTVPSELAAGAATEHTVPLTWTAASDDVAIAGYDVRVDDSRTATTTDTALVVDGLAPGTEYAFRVRAFDAAGNRSAWSDVVRASTDETAPPTPPPAVEVTDARSVATMRVTGSAEQARVAENRWFRHSDLQPTGRWAHRGEELTITTPGAGTSLSIGLYGVHDGTEYSHGSTALPAGTSTVVADRDGMVYVRDTGLTSGATVTVEGGAPVPTWVSGTTNRDTFDRQLDEWTEAPVISLVGDRFLGDFQRTMAEPALADQDIAARVQFIDTSIARTDATYGLADDVAGVAHRHGQRIYIANPDTGGGYASAGNDRLVFQNATKAGKDLLQGPEDDQWGLWHEIGHTYQPKEMRWAGMDEVTVNVSALAVQEGLGHPNRLDKDSIRRAVATFRATPVADREYTDIKDLFVRVLMFDQLRRAFGNDFYAHLAQEFRVENALDLAEPSSDVAVQRHFMLTAARTADRDLTRFFEEWGMPLDDPTREALAELPDLEHAIWDNTDRATDVVERDLGRFVAPVATVASSSTIRFGQQRVGTEDLAVSDVRNADGSAGAEHVESIAVARKVGTDLGRVGALLTNAQGVRNVVTTPVDVRAGSMVAALGISDRTVLQLAVDGSTKSLRAFSGGAIAHQYFPGEQYVGVALHAPDGSLIARGSVNGDQNANALAAALDRTAYAEGSYLVVTHAEPKNRLVVDLEDVRQPKSAVKQHAYRVADGALTEVPLGEVPGR